MAAGEAELSVHSMSRRLPSRRASAWRGRLLPAVPGGGPTNAPRWRAIDGAEGSVGGRNLNGRCAKLQRDGGLRRGVQAVDILARGLVHVRYRLAPK